MTPKLRKSAGRVQFGVTESLPYYRSIIEKEIFETTIHAIQLCLRRDRSPSLFP